jgi:predicted Fe-S protein YdhL (DUF1289 family)
MSRIPQAPGDVASPCISICEISPRWGVCCGCYRTLDEIAEWSLYDADEKRAVLAQLPARREMQERAFAAERIKTHADR